MATNWFKRQQSTIRSSFFGHHSRRPSNASIVESIVPEMPIDGRAALDSFKGHWSQAWAVMQRNCVPSLTPISVDDITSVVNHIDQMVTLLVQESNGAMMMNQSNGSSSPIMMSPLLDYLLLESVLDKIQSWSTNSGEWNHIMKLEQLKLYELLVSQVCHREALFQQPLIRPLLCLLSQCNDRVCPLEVEKRLVVLLNTLCVCLSQNLNLLELFFLKDPPNSSHSHKESRFLIFSLLIPYVHREGAIGQQARDALLLCMALSRFNDMIGTYIAHESTFCPVLATGLSGLYSSLPRKLSQDALLSDDWYRFTSEDIHEVPDLENFLNSLEFCNAVVQISHPLVQQQLLDYVYNGFLVPVIGPALHQDVIDVPLKVLEKLPKYSNTLEEIIATTAYLDLFLRTISEPILLQVFLKFICTEKFEDQKILNTLITRITAHSKLNIITLSLFRTLLDLNCEDIILELVLKYLMNCKHLIGDDEQKVNRIKDISSYHISAQKFLTLIPFCCFSIPSHIKITALDADYEWIDNSDAVSQISNGSDSPLNLNSYVLYNYLDYLNDAHTLVSNCIKATKSWNNNYDAIISSALNNGLEQQYNNSANTVSVPNNSNGIIIRNDSVSDSIPLFGPFLGALFSRLEGMCENDVYTNLQLTGLISRLASYPQPLLRSLLLSSKLSFHNDVKPLWIILSDLRLKLDTSAAQINNFDILLRKARSFLNAREERLLHDKHVRYINEINSPVNRRNSTSSMMSESIDSITKVPLRKRISFKDLFSRKSTASPQNSIPQPILESVSDGHGYRYINQSFTRTAEQGLDACEYEESDRIQKIVLATLVFEEFLKEISAISYEHFILEKHFQSSPSL